MHDPTKVLLGVTQSSAKDISAFAADPATFPAATAVRLKSDGTLSTAVGDGSLVGVSIGQSLSDTKKTAVLRTGELVPLRLTDDEDSYAYVTLGSTVHIDDVTGHANAEADEDIDSTASNATYVSGPLNGVDEAGNIVKVALVDMPGGL